jgi:hypothetical protein
VAYLNIAFGRRSISTAINFLLKLLRGVLLQASTGSFTELTLLHGPKKTLHLTVIDSRTRGSRAKHGGTGSRPFPIYTFHRPPGKRPKAASA